MSRTLLLVDATCVRTKHNSSSIATREEEEKKKREKKQANATGSFVKQLLSPWYHSTATKRRWRMGQIMALNRTAGWSLGPATGAGQSASTTPVTPLYCECVKTVSVGRAYITHSCVILPGAVPSAGHALSSTVDGRNNCPVTCERQPCHHIARLQEFSLLPLTTFGTQVNHSIL
jgi:hypothetical protein